MVNKKEASDEEIQRIIDHRNYKLELWERKRKNQDFIRILFEQWDYYLSEEDSFCVLTFYQKILDENVLDDVPEESEVEIEFDIKEEVIEFLEDLTKKLKEFVIKPEDYELEKEKKD